MAGSTIIQASGAASGSEARLTIDFLAADGTRLGTIPVAPDLDPVLEAARFAALRRGCSPADVRRLDTRVEAVWDAEHGAPFVGMLRGIVVGPDGAEIACDVPRTLLAGLAEDLSARFTEAGTLAAGDVFVYRVCAFPVERRAPRRGSPGAQPEVEGEAQAEAEFEEIVAPAYIEERPRATFAARSLPVGPNEHDDAAVFVPQRVMAEILEQARRAGDVETGGFLLGYVRRDVRGGDVFLEVTEHVPARYVQSHASKLVLTPATWRHVQGVIELRGAGELLLGWQHLHPFFCRNCAAESRARCVFRLPFFSREDRELHATCFPRAWTVGLLVSDHGTSEPSVTMYGWRSAVIGERGFSVVADDVPVTRARRSSAMRAGAASRPDAERGAAGERGTAKRSAAGEPSAAERSAAGAAEGRA